MAVVIQGSVEVKTPNLEPTIGAYKKLKQEIKNAKDELATLDAGTEAYTQKSQQIGALTNQVDDLNKSISAVSGQPMENLNSSFGLLTSQVKNLDLDGVSTSFKSLWSIISANPLTAIASAALLVYQNLDSIKEVLGLNTKEVNNNTEALKAQEAQLKAVQVEQDKYIEKLNDQLELLSLQNAPLAEILNVIKTRTAAEVSAIDLKIKKEKELLESYKAEQAALDEQIRVAKLSSAVTQTGVLTQIAAQQTQLDARKEATKAEIALLESLAVKRDLIIERGKVSEKKATEESIARNKKAAEIDLSFKAKAVDDELSFEELTAKKKLEIQESYYQTREQFALTSSAQEADARLKIEAENAKAIAEEQQKWQKMAFDSGIALSSLFYDIKSGNAQKGSKEEQEAAKKSFELSKAFQLANAVMSGIQGVQNAFTSGSLVPLIGAITGPAYAAAAGIVAAANIAKIAKTKFTPTSSAVPIDRGTTGSVSLPSVTPTAPTAPPRTDLNPDGTVAGSTNTNTAIPVYEGDISTVQKRVTVLEGRASF